MRRYALRASILLFAVSAVVLTAADSPGGKASSTYGIEIRLAPKESVPGQFSCEAIVTDLGTGKVISNPHVEFLQGKSGTTLMDEAGKREVMLTAGVEGNATRASYTVEIREGETLVSSQKGSVKLR